MELSPEEKERIYLEEKARIEAQEQVKKELAEKEAKEKAEKAAAEQKKTATGCLGCLGVIFLVALIGSLSDTNKSPSSSPSAKSEPREIVSNSPWDGSVHQVESWLRENLKDPDSLEIIEWSPVQAVGTGFAVRCKYRAKNGFGGYVIEQKLFHLDSAGRVTSAAEW